MGTHASVELDDYAHEAYREYRAAANELTDATARKDKARDALVTFLRLNDATAATLDGDLVLRLVETDRVTVDAPRLKVEEPFIYRRFARVTHVEYLRPVDGAA
jgi:hypothetical protein